jgi:stage II sporulation protein D
MVYRRIVGRLSVAIACLAISVPALAPSLAAAQQVLVIDGAGSGHGVGMSQYGAYGLALHGSDYRSILAHYYSGTQLQALPGRRVSVLLEAGRSSATFAGASAAATNHRLNRRATYHARAAGQGVAIYDARGHRVASATALTISGPAPLTLAGQALNGRSNGRYRGSLELRQAAGSLEVFNVLGVDDYVRGVVAAESDPAWPLAELEAQAVASRTYAITSGRLYADTRSQQYNGVAAETAKTDRAVALTAGQIVTYHGRPAITYYFDTSGGLTENIEFAFPGTARAPWLVSVADPFDALSPLHHWGPYRLSLGEAASRLSGLLKGTLRSIEVVKRGVSPRIVSADVVGSGGRVRTSGNELAARLRLPASWACFVVTGPDGIAPPGWDAACHVGLTPPLSPGQGGGVAAP